MTIFDQRGQTVTYQYNVHGTINFGAVQTPPDLVAELRKLQAEMRQATAAGAVQGETATDAGYQLDKAVHEAEKPQPDKKKVAGYLAQPSPLIHHPHCSFASAKLPGAGCSPAHFVKPYPRPSTQIPTPRNQPKSPANRAKPHDLEPLNIKISAPMQQGRTFVL